MNENNIINTINFVENSISKNDKTINIKRKFFLPKINQKYLPFQHSLKIFNNISKDKQINLRYKLNHPKFLTLTKSEEKKILLKNSTNKRFNSNIINDSQNKPIIKLLHNKISISNNSPKETKKKELKRNIILKKYMNEAILYKKSYFQKKKMNVGKIFNMPLSHKNIAISDDMKMNENENKNKNKKTINTTIKYRNDRRSIRIRKFKTQDKNIVLEDSNDYLMPNLKKNCNLKYHYDRNKDGIDKITADLKSLEERTKITFNKFKNDTDQIFQSIYYNNNINSII
jgi:hypothetical protein